VSVHGRRESGHTEKCPEKLRVAESLTRIDEPSNTTQSQFDGPNSTGVLPGSDGGCWQVCVGGDVTLDLWSNDDERVGQKLDKGGNGAEER
jgi:hypothetical protein